jgi:hypothetical protein
MTSCRRYLLLLFFSAAAAALSGQTAPDAEAGEARVAKDIPRSYRDISLGMTPDEVKELLSADSWFNYRGEADVSLLERPRASLIDAGGSLFIARGLFQFEEERLITIVLELNPETIDWFTVYTTLEGRYGNPADMNPSMARWEDGKTRLSLERPLTVKYLDLEYFAAAIAGETDRKAWRQAAREDFLDEF